MSGPNNRLSSKQQRVASAVSAMYLWSKEAARKGVGSFAKRINRASQARVSPEMEQAIGRDLIARAAQSGDVEELRKALASYPMALRLTSDQGVTPLMIAAKWGRAECVKELLKIVPVDAKTASEETAIRFAVIEGHYECVKELLPYSEVDFKYTRSTTLLMWAVGLSEGSSEMVELLLKKADPNQISRHQNVTALMIAAGRGNVEAVQALLKVSDLSIRDSGGRSAADYAQTGGHLSIADDISSYQARREALEIEGELKGVMKAPKPAQKVGARL